MKKMVKRKQINLFLLIFLVLTFFILAGPAITHGGNGQPGDGVNSPPPTNSVETVSPFDTLLLSMVQSIVI